MLKRALNIAAGVSTGLILISSAPAALALSVSPARTEVRVPPGGTVKAVITVSNPHPEAYDVELSEKPWFVLPENQKIHVEDWLHLPGKKQFRLKPGKSRDIQLTISCPKEAVGELMGMVSFAYQGLQASMITPMISAPVYLQVEGTVKNTGDIVALGAGTRNGQFLVGVQIKATGNVRLRPVGPIRLLDAKGSEVAAYVVPETTPIFPGETHDLSGRGSTAVPPAGHYTLSAELRSGSLELKTQRGVTVDAQGVVTMESEKKS